MPRPPTTPSFWPEAPPPPRALLNINITGVESLVDLLDGVRALQAEMAARTVTFDQAEAELLRLVTTLEGETLG